MVHTFDFLYFYGGRADLYIEGIWHSWDSLPEIGERVPEYVLRTLCAISPPLLTEKDPTKRADAARLRLQEALKTLNTKGTLLNTYVNDAIGYLANSWNVGNDHRSIFPAYLARLLLVRLVVAFLHSDSISAKLFSEPLIRGGEPTGYRKRVCLLDLEPIGNPLRFVREHIRAAPNEAESVWVLQNLAFNLDGTP